MGTWYNHNYNILVNHGQILLINMNGEGENGIHEPNKK